jgi:hypothetical protein
VETNKVSAEEIAALLTIYFDNMAAMNAKGWLEIFLKMPSSMIQLETPKACTQNSQQFFK